MAENSIVLESRLVGDIEGKFFIPSYQRGYRWGQTEVERLLDDIYNNGQNNYCLQPIVVKKGLNSFELIDGQQRLTTIYLIYKYMNDFSGGFIGEPKFKIEYETRENSAKFLKEMDLSKKNENIDFWFMAQAYELIKGWFEEKGKTSVMTNINKYLDENVKVIWYEVADSEDSIALFTRLNIGKIPLTSSELVKAMFLSQSKNISMTEEKKDEIALQWDNIEKQLNNDSLWYFLTNSFNKDYQTRIDLILDLMAKKDKNNKDNYYTFFYFDALSNERELDVIWQAIQHTFLILKDWYEDHGLYHKIGYLIASGSMNLQEIHNLSMEKINGEMIGKKEFRNRLDTMIKDSIKINTNYGELSYDKETDKKQISKLLLLFNIESVRQNGEKTKWFPFEKHKYLESGKVQWTLEHIHAQHSQGMRTQDEWKEWLRLHIPSIIALSGEDNKSLVEEMESMINNKRLIGSDFENLQERVINKLSKGSNSDYIHSLSNLTLLNTGDNAALSNSTFDVKRNLIVNMDKGGQYIPFSTRMVFLKYYTSSSSSQLAFWDQEDRKAYIDAINQVLADYLFELIIL